MFSTDWRFILLILNLLVIAVFGYFYALNFNLEFLLYAGIATAIAVILYVTRHRSQFPVFIHAGIAAWVLAHMAGGIVPTADGVLYKYRIVEIFDGGGELFILKYDQVIHFGLYALVALMFYHVLRNHVQGSRGLLLVVSAFASAGFSILNEVVEFAAVVAVPDTGVGGYFNTVLDLIFNFAGAAFAVTVWYLWFD